MNILLIILATIAAIVLFVLVLGLFTKKAYRLERTVTISRPVGQVFEYIRLLKNQDNYHKWVMMDPAMKKEFVGTDGTTGFIYGWDGNKRVGAGEQEITRIELGKRIDTEVRFRRPFKGVASSFIETDPVAHGDSTKVKWNFSSRLNYPANIFLLFMNPEKTLGRDLQTSLVNLKSILEK